MLRIHRRLLFFALVSLVEGQELKQGKASDRERPSYLLSGRLVAWSPSKAKPFGGNFPLPRNVLPHRLGTDSEREPRCRRSKNRKRCVPLCSIFFDITAKRNTQLTLEMKEFVAHEAFLFVSLRALNFLHQQVLINEKFIGVNKKNRLLNLPLRKGTIRSSGRTKLTIRSIEVNPVTHSNTNYERPRMLCTSYLRWNASKSQLDVPMTVGQDKLLKSDKH